MIALEVRALEVRALEVRALEVNAVKASTAFYPNGVPAISRWSSETTPPELAFVPSDPERVAAMNKLGMNAATLLHLKRQFPSDLTLVQAIFFKRQRLTAPRVVSTNTHLAIV